MAICEGCAHENSQGVQFCVSCGRVLPSTNGPRRNVAPEDIADFGSSDMFEGMFGKSSKAKQATPKQANSNRASSDQTSSRPSQKGPGPAASAPAATPSATPETRAAKLAQVAKAGSKALVKSVALSLAVLGPGFVMLLMGYSVLGMIWLFAGSFGLMAWTYRKPWRLGMISCLLPPAAAAVCYLVQLGIFGADAPPAMLVAAAVAIGISVGYWRAQSHEVKQGDDGGIIAARTIHYLLVWVAAYAVTQALGILAIGTFAVPAGLVTGAFSTAMLAMVSVVIWRRYKALAGQLAVGVLVIIAGLFAPLDRAEAQDSVCATIFSQSDRSYKRLQRNCVSNFRKGIRDAELLSILAQKSAGRSGTFRQEQEADRLASSGGKANLLKAFDTYAQVYRAEVADDLWKRREILQKMINLASKDRSREMVQRVESIAGNYNALNVRICRAQSRGYGGLPKFAREKSNADFCLQRAQAAAPKQQAPTPATNQRSGTTLGPDTDLCWATNSRGYIAPSPGLSPNDPNCLFTLTCRRAMDIHRQGGRVEFQDRRYKSKSVGQIRPEECAQVVPGASAGSENSGATPSGVDGSDSGSNGGQTVDPDWEYEPPQPGQQNDLIETSATAAAAVATVLIAAGVAVNVAQAIAAAIANALQAGVQLTSEEIQQAISEALRGKQPTTPDNAGATPAPEPRPEEDNAPPNVQSTERVRPPTPIYDENGEPFETNHQGQYWGPDDKGDWRWLSRAEAQEASQALRGERAQRQADQAEFERRAAADRDAWRQRNEQEAREAEAARAKHEREVAARDAAEKTRRDNLETSIFNALDGDPESSDYSALMEQFAGAQQRGDTDELENIWDQLRGRRQRQLDELDAEAKSRQAESDQAQMIETGVTWVRDGSKVVATVGLGVATGGTASVIQGAGAVVIGGGALTTIGAIEGGLTAKDGEVQADGWQAARGAARGALGAAGAAVGGVAAGGSRVVMGAKTVFAGTSTYGQTYADTYDKTGDHDLARSRATMAAMADAAKTATGELFDEGARLSQQRADAMKMDAPAGWGDVSSQTWGQAIDGVHATEQTMLAAAKTAANVAGSTLGNIATADKDSDATFGTAFGNALWSEAKGRAAGKLVGKAEAGGPGLTTQQMNEIDRLNAERAGTAKQPDITPEYAAHLERTGKSTTDYEEGPAHAEEGGGFSPTAQRHAQRVADNLGVKITARTVEAEGAEAVDQGRAIPKRPDMKANSGKDADIPLGMEPGHKNRVVVFEPTMPTPEALEGHLGRPPTQDDWDAVQERFDLRADQHQTYQQKIADSETYHMDGQRVIDTESGLPIGPDMDVWGVTGLYGEPVPRAVQAEALRQLTRNPEIVGQDIGSTVEHNDHLSWDIGALDNTKIGPNGKTEYEDAVDTNNRIIGTVRPGGNPLATFTGRPGVAPPQVGSSFYTGAGANTKRSDDG